MEVRFKLEKETKGALRYQEVDDAGKAVEQASAKIGTLYMRKSRGSAWPYRSASGTWSRTTGSVWRRLSGRKDGANMRFDK
jgi:hypothetical protein